MLHIFHFPGTMLRYLTPYTIHPPPYEVPYLARPTTEYYYYYYYSYYSYYYYITMYETTSYDTTTVDYYGCTMRSHAMPDHTIPVPYQPVLVLMTIDKQPAPNPTHHHPLFLYRGTPSSWPADTLLVLPLICSPPSFSLILDFFMLSLSLSPRSHLSCSLPCLLLLYHLLLLYLPSPFLGVEEEIPLLFPLFDASTLTSVLSLIGIKDPPCLSFLLESCEHTFLLLVIASWLLVRSWLFRVYNSYLSTYLPTYQPTNRQTLEPWNYQPTQVAT
ncbi:hypothetical protein F4778DRAFT_191561 [Xylariomycetidae sp. FL2044]|nr:hypothetical protein F4778DRAFT_191561 [Xylariomycetidae sp. FL2044]